MKTILFAVTVIMMSLGASAGLFDFLTGQGAKSASDELFDTLKFDASQIACGSVSDLKWKLKRKYLRDDGTVEIYPLNSGVPQYVDPKTLQAGDVEINCKAGPERLCFSAQYEERMEKLRVKKLEQEQAEREAKRLEENRQKIVVKYDEILAGRDKEKFLARMEKINGLFAEVNQGLELLKSAPEELRCRSRRDPQKCINSFTNLQQEILVSATNVDSIVDAVVSNDVVRLVLVGKDEFLARGNARLIKHHGSDPNWSGSIWCLEGQNNDEHWCLSRLGEIKMVQHDIKDYLAREAEKKAAAEKKRKEEEARLNAAKQLLAQGEKVKYPQGVLTPLHVPMYADLKSGLSLQWLDAWVLVNSVNAFKYEGQDGCASRTIRYSGHKVELEFKQGLLYKVVVKFDDDDNIKLDSIVKKYTKEFGPTTKTEKIDETIFFDQSTDDSVFYTKKTKHKIKGDSKLYVIAQTKGFGGYMYVGPDTMSSMVFMTESEKLSYLDFNPNGRADLIIDSEGNILKKTPVGEKVAGIALSRLSGVVKQALTVTELAIVDGDLEGKINAQKEAQQRQADEVAERKRKKREAAALNF